ncbi:hypothetical protein HAD_10025 [Hyphomonas adhaerens MHS-3]|uniref:SMP-30/Gluconolactonase/LRE-like region domain-containing protein n=1 Tax=Hyphomonas adhaerens MHS-3 TaxID=1280949 RepID=A0A069E9K0_9PROT|nr:hypothetical protein [Hyphomonas adhaerens]KCZ86016.1 hypothetical protein HAD_10025 [Hyphomonas adhaerens MHS-3]
MSALSTSPADNRAGIYILDRQRGTPIETVLYWSPEAATQTFAPSSCGLTTPARLAPHGIAIGSFASDTEHLLVIAHAPVEAVLVFDIQQDDGNITLTENTCLALPQGVFANAVTALGPNGLAVTKMFNPQEGDPFERFSKQQDTGSILTWFPATGWQDHKQLRLSGPNGLLWEEETNSLIVAEWARHQIMRIPAGETDGDLGDAQILTKLSYMPDNLRWSRDGDILVTGQGSSIGEGHACIAGEAECPTGFEITWIDPVVGTIRQVASIASSDFGMASVAAEVDDRIWVGSVSGNQIAEVIVIHPQISGSEK